MTAGASQQVITAPAAEAALPAAGLVKTTGAQLLAAFPPRPVASSWPATQASRPAVLTRVLATPFTLDNPASQQTRRLGVLAVLTWLHTHPGDSWQQRWQASGAEDQPDWRALITNATAGRPRARTATGTQLPHLGPGLLVLICADVIRPSLGWLLRFAPARRGLAAEMGRTRDSAAFALLAGMCTQGRVGLQSGQQALTRIAVILAAKGGPAAAVQVGDCVELLQVTAGMRATSEVHAHSTLFYQLLRSLGALGEDAPAAMEMFSGRGQPTCEQLIDRYRIACRPVRDVLVDYLRERQPSVDFSSLQRFAYLLGKPVLGRPGGPPSRHRLPQAAPRRGRRMEAAGDDPHPHDRLSRRRVTTRLTSTRLDGRTCCPRCVPFISTSPSGLTTTRPGGARGRCAARSAPAKSPARRTGHGASHGWTSAPANGSRYCPSWSPRRRRTGPHRRDARRSRTHRPRRAVHRGRARRCAVLSCRTGTSGRVWAEAPGHGRRRDLSFEEHRGFWTWATVEVLRQHRHPDRRTRRIVTPQPDPVPAARHRRADPAAADRPVQDRYREAATY